jgi:trigger factor
LVEQLTLNQRVVGSRPTRPIIIYKAKVAELVDALVLGTSGTPRESSSLSFRTIFKMPEVLDMQVSVETTGGLERRMTVGVPREGIEPQLKKRLQTLARQTKINGFRPGKVPMRVVEQRYGQKVRQEILGEVLQSSFNEAITQEKLHPIGEPSFNLNTELKQLEQGLSYTAVFEIYPEIPLLQVEGLNIERLMAEVTNSDIDTMLQRLRQQRQTWHIVDRPCQEGDRLIIDFVNTQGKEFKTDEFQQVPIIVGQPSLILPGIETKLTGVKANENHDIELTFPADYPKPDFAGQTLSLTIRVLSVEEGQLPEINEEFAKAFGVADGSIETLRQDARDNMERELIYAQERRLKQQVLDALIAANPIEVPQSLIKEETQRLVKMREQEWKTQNLRAELFTEEALKRVKIGILVGELIKIHNLKPPPDKVRQMVERMAFAYEDREAVIRSYYADSERMKEIESMVLEDEVVNWLLERAQVTEKNTDFYTVLEKT